jgi:hypothetical protein
MGFIWFMAGLAAVSGAVLGGMLSWDLLRLLRKSNLVAEVVPEPISHTDRTTSARSWLQPRIRIWIRNSMTIAAVLALLAGAVYYYTEVADPFSAAGTLRVSGAVAELTEFRYEEWLDAEVTITTEMQGSLSYIPPRPYTGVPIALVLEAVHPNEDATEVVVTSSDGYQKSFDLQTLRSNREVILVLEDQELNLVAAGFDGSYWVKQVSRIVVR